MAETKEPKTLPKPPTQFAMDRLKSLVDVIAIDVVRVSAFKYRVILRGKNLLFDRVAYEGFSEARANRKAEELARDEWGSKEEPITLRRLTPLDKKEWDNK